MEQRVEGDQDSGSGAPAPERYVRFEPLRRVVWAVAACTLLASLTVLLTVGRHASLLLMLVLCAQISRGRPRPTESSFMRRRICQQIAVAICSLLALLTMSACIPWSPDEPEPYLHRVETMWGIEVPSGAEVLEYYSSEADFHGGRDEVYVLGIPAADRAEGWDPADYGDGIPSDGAPTAGEVSASAGSPITDDMVHSLSCADPERDEQNYLLICFDEKDEAFYLFHQIF